MSYRDKINKTSQEKNTRIILALDLPYTPPTNKNALLTRAQHVLSQVHPYICAVKINHHLTLPLGTYNGVQTLIKQAHDNGLTTIIDCKANDIGSTNQIIAQYYYTAGFDALIANPFIGWQEGLEPIFNTAKQNQNGVILLVYMSHKAAPEGYGQTIIDPKTHKQTPQYTAFAKTALKHKADGAVVGATYPPKIQEIHAILKEKVPIYSPGIGAQGATIAPAIRSGSRYLIVGREITLADNPVDTAKRIRDTARSIH